jgi:hypothetical protein
MKAERILLTHFSKRVNSGLPTFVGVDVNKDLERVCIAFDFMRIKMSQLHSLPQLLPIFLHVFKDAN